MLLLMQILKNYSHIFFSIFATKNKLHNKLFDYSLEIKKRIFFSQKTNFMINCLCSIYILHELVSNISLKKNNHQCLENLGKLISVKHVNMIFVWPKLFSNVTIKKRKRKRRKNKRKNTLACKKKKKSPLQINIFYKRPIY